MADKKSWNVVGDWLWHALFVQCPKCNGGGLILTDPSPIPIALEGLPSNEDKPPALFDTPEAALEAGKSFIERFGDQLANLPHPPQPPCRCSSCGFLMTSETVTERIKNGYSCTAYAWVCPECSVFQFIIPEITKIEYPDDPVALERGDKTTHYEDCEILECKKCHNKSRRGILMYGDGFWSEIGGFLNKL